MPSHIILFFLLQETCCCLLLFFFLFNGLVSSEDDELDIFFLKVFMDDASAQLINQERPLPKRKKTKYLCFFLTHIFLLIIKISSCQFITLSHPILLIIICMFVIFLYFVFLVFIDFFLFASQQKPVDLTLFISQIGKKKKLPLRRFIYISLCHITQRENLLLLLSLTLISLNVTNTHV